MKMIKRRFEQFLFYDYTGIEIHLERMAFKGWKLHKITPLYWEYQRIEPQKLDYTVTYFSEASEFNPYPTKNQQTFHEYCKDAGWKLVAEWSQMQVFCTEQRNSTPIETEASIKLKAIHRAMKKNFLPSSLLLLLLYLVQVFLQLHLIVSEPVYQLSSISSLFLVVIWSVLIIQTLFNLNGYIIWFRKSWKAVDMGETCIESSSGYKKTSYFLTGIIIILLLFTIMSQSFGWVGIFGIINITVIIILILAIKNALKQAEASRKVNLTVTMVSCVILSFVMTGAMGWGIVRGMNAGLFSSRQPDETYTATMPDGSSHIWDIYHDILPLKVEDIQDVDYDHYSYEWTERESFLLAQYLARQDSFPDGKLAPEVNYAIVDVKFPRLFDICLNDYLDMYEWEELKEDKRYFLITNDPAWKADMVYQLYRLDEALDEYILCWGSRIVYINFDEIPTSEQIAIVVEKFSQN